MKNLIKSYLCLFLVTCVYTAYGQEKYNLPPEKYYEKATVGFMNLQKKNVERLSIENDSIWYIKNNKLFYHHLDDINYIKINKGTKAKQGALAGGGSMLGLMLLAILDVESDPEYELKENAGVIVALMTLGGAVTGAIIGSMSKVTNSYFIHAQPEYSPEDPYDNSLDPVQSNAAKNKGM
jgi:hypothetical protein